MNGIRLPLALSLAAHAMILAALWLLPPPPPAEAPVAARGIEVAFAASLPKAESAPAPQPVMARPAPPEPTPAPSAPPEATQAAPPPPVAPPPPRPAVAALEPPRSTPEPIPAVPEPLPLPPPPKPPVPRQARHPVHREPPMPSIERPRPAIAAAPHVPAMPSLPAMPAPPAAPQSEPVPAPTRQTGIAPVPPGLAAPAVSPGYEAALGEWLNTHKRYPESARLRGEQGRAVLRFAVERNGRVTDFAVVRSSGYPDLDAGLEEMMRGAVLPPFPADMPQSNITVSVTIRFALER